MKSYEIEWHLNAHYEIVSIVRKVSKVWHLCRPNNWVISTYYYFNFIKFLVPNQNSFRGIALQTKRMADNLADRHICRQTSKVCVHMCI